jgi:Sec-independent protein translocase protein TatA
MLSRPRPLYHRPMGSDVLIVLVIVLVAVLVVRGPKTLPKWGATLGRGFREAKTEAAKAQAEIQARTGSTSDPTEPTDTGDDRPA